MKIFNLLFFNFILIYNLSGQQIAHYSNYIENSYYLNPSISSPLRKRVLLAYRNHWSGFSGAPKTSLISFQFPFFLKTNSKSYSCFGGYLQNDKIGPFFNTSLNFSYSYSFLLNDRLRVSFGSFLGIQQLGLDVTSLESFHPNDPVIDISNYSLLSPILDFGITLSNQNFFVALSTKQLTQNNWRNIIKSELSSNVTSYILLFGKSLKNDVIVLSPNFLIDYHPKLPTLLLLGFNVSYRNIFNIGMLTKNEDSFISTLKINVNENIHFLYGYEFSYSSKNPVRTNAHEFMISYHTSVVEKMQRTNLISYF